MNPMRWFRNAESALPFNPSTRVPPDGEGTGIGGIEGAEDLEQGGFARTAGTRDGGDLRSFNVQVDRHSIR